MKKAIFSLLAMLLLTVCLYPQTCTRDEKGDSYRLRTWVNNDNPESKCIEIFFVNPADKAELQNAVKDVPGVDTVYNENNKYYFSMRVSLMFELDQVFDNVNNAVKAFYEARDEVQK